MPGPVSDSYDPEFGTAANADEVKQAARLTRIAVTGFIGTEDRRHILDVARHLGGKSTPVPFTENQLRMIRFCLDRFIEE